MSYTKELELMISKKYLMNSYKLFWLKAIFVVSKKDYQVVSFKELGAWMIAYSWKHTVFDNKVLGYWDRLFEANCTVLEQLDLFASNTPNEVYQSVIAANNKEVNKEIKKILKYVPYRLLSYRWNEYLNGMKDSLRNASIKNFSQGEAGVFYSIFDDYISIDPNWSKYIEEHQKELLKWIDVKIDEFISANSRQRDESW